MSTLFAVDAAWPPPVDVLKAHNVELVLGYYGAEGCTPYVWSVAEVEAVLAAGMAFAPIWTPPQEPTLGGPDTRTALISVLSSRGYPQGSPVFIDVEGSTWVAGAGPAAHDLADAVTVAGWPCYLYGPPGKGQWRAEWPQPAPTAMPDTTLLSGEVGWQYAGAVTWGGEYGVDLSVFRADLAWWRKTPAATPTPAPTPVPEPTATKETPVATIYVASDDSTNKTPLGHPEVGAGDGIIVYEGGLVVHIPNDTDLQALVKRFGDAVSVSGQCVYNHVRKYG
ncbi:MAG: hypothetical protein ACYCV4_18875 [Dermatophilaceae bacterium]